MDRPVAKGELVERVATSMTISAAAGPRRPRFDLATEADDAEIRRILRENSMGGSISISLEREPDARLAADVEGPLLHQTIVGRRTGGGLFGFGTRSARVAYLNGKPSPLGYLGALRLDADFRGNASVLRQGYRRLRDLHEHDGTTPLYLTSIMADNGPARRVFEANLKGLPTYRFAGEFITHVMRVRRSGDWFGWRAADARRRLNHIGCQLYAGTDFDSADIAGLLQRGLAPYQFAPQWTRQLLTYPRTSLGLDAEDFVVATLGGQLIGCAALWDQTGFKQSVVRGYPRGLALARPFVNGLNSVLRRPRLPRAGDPMRLAFVSHLATIPRADPRVAVSLIEALHGLADQRAMDYLCVGLAADDPQLPSITSAFPGRQLRSRLYTVFWPDGPAAADSLDGRTLRPEVALL